MPMWGKRKRESETKLSTVKYSNLVGSLHSPIPINSDVTAEAMSKRTAESKQRNLRDQEDLKHREEQHARYIMEHLLEDPKVQKGLRYIDNCIIRQANLGCSSLELGEVCRGKGVENNYYVSIDRIYPDSGVGAGKYVQFKDVREKVVDYYRSKGFKVEQYHHTFSGGPSSKHVNEDGQEEWRAEISSENILISWAKEEE